MKIVSEQRIKEIYQQMKNIEEHTENYVKNPSSYRLEFGRSSEKTAVRVLSIQILLVYYRIRPSAYVDHYIIDRKPFEQFEEIMKELDLNYKIQEHHLPEEQKLEIMAKYTNVSREFVDKPTYSVILAHKETVIKSSEMTQKQIGEFLGYKCARDDFNQDDKKYVFHVEKDRIPYLKNRFICGEYNTNPKQHAWILGESWVERTGVKLEDLVDHYNDFIEKCERHLGPLDLRLCCTVENPEKGEEIDVKMLKDKEIFKDFFEIK